jgi:predicted lactoylglutathione lyase
MFDHIGIRVPDRAGSESVLETVLAKLDIETSVSTSSFAIWHEFVLSEIDPGHPGTRRVHIAFVAPSREQVEDFWQAGVDAGYHDDGAPGLRPQYREDYYGAFLLDQAGNSFEAVHHGEQQSDSKIDHVAIRVSDLAASTAFYRLVADAAGLDLRSEGPERTTFQGGASGGLLSRPQYHPGYYAAFVLDPDANNIEIVNQHQS